MSVINEQWLQDVAESIRLPPLIPLVCQKLLPVVEIQLRKLLQQSSKFQKKGKSSKLSVADFNLALSMNHIEPLYGLSATDLQLASNHKKVNFDDRISVDVFAEQNLPPCPIQTDVHLHWLVVNGYQPNVPENPHVSSNETDEQPNNLIKELQQIYSRMTGIILAGEESPAFQTVMHILQNDTGIQQLVPYFSRFFYHQIKLNIRRLPLLNIIITSIRSLISNNNLFVENYLQQLLPAIITCVVAAKLSVTDHEDHWTLRETAANLIALICNRYEEIFGDLRSRVCKTYVDAITSEDKPLTTLYGGLIGLATLRYEDVKMQLIPQLNVLHRRLGGAVGDTFDENGLLHRSKDIVWTSVDMDPSMFDDESDGVKLTNAVLSKKRKLTTSDEINKSSIPNTSSSSSAATAAVLLKPLPTYKLKGKLDLNQFVIQRCKQLLLKTLGDYIVRSLKAPFQSREEYAKRKVRIAAARRVTGTTSQHSIQRGLLLPTHDLMIRQLDPIQEFDPSLHTLIHIVYTMEVSLADEIKDFLQFGPINTTSSVLDNDSCVNNIDFIIQIRNETNKLLLRTDEHVQGKQHRINSKIEHLQGKVSTCYNALHIQQLREKITKYKLLQAKIHHMSLMIAIKKFKEYQSIDDIPKLIFDVIDEVRLLLTNHSKLKAVVMNVVKEMKVPLLQNFHKLFEDHLLDTKNHNEGKTNQSSMWTAFLAKARDRLLGYALINLLPCVITESTNSVMDKYQETLDDAFTPLWGKFHYHLKMAREDHSNSNHIRWSFKYSKSFVQMLSDLSNQITASGELQKLCRGESRGDYQEAGLKMVIDKAVRFLRAHIAIIIEEYMNVDHVTDGIDDEGRRSNRTMELIEDTLELDHHLHQIFASNTNICEVLYDEKKLFMQWLAIDRHQIESKLLKILNGDEQKIFSLHLQRREVNEDLIPRTEVSSSVSCYAGLHGVLCLLMQLIERYQSLSSTAQNIFSDSMIDPLLLVMMGLLLYRIRSDPILYSLSCGKYHPSSSSSSSSIRSNSSPSKDQTESSSHLTSQPNQTILPNVLSDFRNSVHYFQLSLTSYRKKSFAANSNRLQDKWKRIQKWLPKTAITYADTKNGFSIADLTKKCFALEKSIVLHDVHDFIAISQDKSVDSMINCLDFVRATAITMSNVLENELHQMK